MNIKVLLIAVAQLCIAVSSFSQIDSTFKDSIEEIVIYEYDTVYLAVDTIHITDTVVNIVKQNETHKNAAISTKNNSFFKGIKPNFVEVFVAPFASGNFGDKKLSDSLSSVAVLNFSYFLKLNYSLNNYILTFGLGFTPYHEKYTFRRDYYSSNKELSPDGIYDSLLINKAYIENIYCNYLNFSLLLKRQWSLNPNISILLKAGGVADILLQYSQETNNVDASTIRNFDFSAIIGFELSYKFSKKIEVYLSPIYQHSLLNDHLNPSTSFQKAGLGLGFRLFL